MAYLENIWDNSYVISARDSVVSAEASRASPEIYFDYVYKYPAATSLSADPPAQFLTVPTCGGARGSIVVKALCYIPEGREFDTRWGDFLNLPNPSGRTMP
jgi:hypothetical protein